MQAEIADVADDAGPKQAGGCWWCTFYWTRSLLTRRICMSQYSAPCVYIWVASTVLIVARHWFGAMLLRFKPSARPLNAAPGGPSRHFVYDASNYLGHSAIPWSLWMSMTTS